MEAAFEELSAEAVDLYLGKSIPAVDIADLSPLTFYRGYVSKNRPIVIRNAFNHWPALTKKWTQENLTRLMSDDLISVAITPNGYADAVTNGKFMLPDEVKMTFSQFIDELGKSSGVDNSMDAPVIHYIQKQNSNMTTEFSALINDVDDHLPWATEAFGCLPDAVNFWMGDERAVTSLHKDHYENIYCVVSGSKVFTLIPPTDQPYIPYIDAPLAQYKLTPQGWTVETNKDGETVPWIPVDPIQPDLLTYPEFSKAHIYTVTINRGDALYLPSLWYHHVSQSHGCIAVNYWYDMQFDIKYNYYQFVSNLLKINSS